MLRLIYRAALCIVLLAHAGSALPQLPMVVNGTVLINGEPAPVGTEIKALIDGEVKGSYIIREKGLYGMIVEYKPGSNIVDFYVNGIKSQSIHWSVEPGTLNLIITTSQAAREATTATATQTATSTATNEARTADTVTPEAQVTVLQQENDTHAPQKQARVESPGFEAIIVVFALLLASKARQGII